MKIRPVEAESFFADGMTDMMQVIVGFSQFYESA